MPTYFTIILRMEIDLDESFTQYGDYSIEKSTILSLKHSFFVKKCWHILLISKSQKEYYAFLSKYN